MKQNEEMNRLGKGRGRESVRDAKIFRTLAINAICFISIIFEDMKLPLHMGTCCSVSHVLTKFGVDI